MRFHQVFLSILGRAIEGSFLDFGGDFGTLILLAMSSDEFEELQTTGVVMLERSQAKSKPTSSKSSAALNLPKKDFAKDQRKEKITSWFSSRTSTAEGPRAPLSPILVCSDDDFVDAPPKESKPKPKIASKSTSLEYEPVILNAPNTSDTQPIVVPKCIGAHLKEHQKKAIQFMWSHVVGSESMLSSNDRFKGSGCLLAHRLACASNTVLLCYGTVMFL